MVVHFALPTPLAMPATSRGLIDSYSMGLSKVSLWIKPISPDVLVSSLALEM